MRSATARRWLGPAIVVGSTTLLVGLVVTFFSVEVWVTSAVLLWATSAAPVVLGRSSWWGR